MSAAESIVLTGRVYGRESHARITVRDGVIQEVREASAGEAGSRWIVPGFFELQVNGFAGHDFCMPEVSTEAVEGAARAMLATGVTRFLATVITASIDALCAEAAAIQRAMEVSPLVRRMCPGLHVEGPFIHPEDGPRGAHPREHVRPPSVKDFDRIYDAAGGAIRILTVAADQPGAPELIAHATRNGVLVAIGHHRAEASHIEAALAAGARMCTHLGNGLDATVPRLDNAIWRQLGEDRLWASFIADGHHLPPATLRCMLRAKGLERTVLVTDAVAAAGMPPGRYRLGNIEVERTAAGKVVLPGTPYLAGSAADMPLCVNTAIRAGGVSLSDAVRMASINPGHLLLSEPLAWAPRLGAAANLVELEQSASGEVTVRQAVAGEFVSSGV